MFLDHSDLVSLESWEDGAKVQDTFLRMKAARNWSNVTYNSYRKSLLSYFQALADADLVPRNPLRKVRKCPEAPKDQPKLDKAQLRPLFRELATYRSGVSYLLHYRNYLFFLLAYYTGARPVEILDLKLGSFSADRSAVRVVSAK